MTRPRAYLLAAALILAAILAGLLLGVVIAGRMEMYLS